LLDSVTWISCCLCSLSEPWTNPPLLRLIPTCLCSTGSWTFPS